MVKDRTLACTLRDVRTDAIGCTNDLLAYRVSRKRAPFLHNLPDVVCEFLGKLVNTQSLEMSSRHA